MAEREELSRLEELAMTITDSEEEEEDGEEEDDEEEDFKQLELLEKEESKKGEKVKKTEIASMIEDIETAAFTSTIVLEPLETELDDEEDETEDNAEKDLVDTNVTKGEELQLNIDISQMEVIGLVSETDADMVEEQEKEEEDEDEDEDQNKSDSSSSEDEELPKAFESASDLCDNYLDHLTNMLQALAAELQRNLKRQEEIDEQVALKQFMGGFKTNNL